MHTYGIIGYPLSHSFSSKIFEDIFWRESLDCRYVNFEIRDLEQLDEFLSKREFNGLNITHPFKEAIISRLDELDPVASHIGAVNVVVNRDGRLVGYNTDSDGFKRSLLSYYEDTSMPQPPRRVMVLGTGGAARAVCHALSVLNRDVTNVSRDPRKARITYDMLNREILDAHRLIVNCTPLGMYPDVDSAPPIPYHLLSHLHVLYDLVYNPPFTTFMRLGQQYGAITINGRVMLQYQAMAAWDIWRSEIIRKEY